MTWLSFQWWRLVFIAQRLLGHPEWSERYWERQGMRRVLGGRWGLWEICMGGMMGTFRMWYPSPCEHYPRLPFATSTEPLEVEEYD